MSKAFYHFCFNEWVNTVKSLDQSGDGKYGESEDFYGTKTLEQAYQIMDRGYIPEGGFDPIEIGESERLSDIVTWDVVGAVPCVATYLSGLPHCMIDLTPSPVEKRFIKLAVQVNSNGGVGAQKMKDYNERVYHAIAALKEMGVEVDMAVLLRNNLDGTEETILVDICSGGEVFSPAILSAAMHPSFFRRLWFIWAYDKYGSYGSSEIPDKVINGYHVLPSVNFASGVDLKAFILDCIDQQQLQIA